MQQTVNIREALSATPIHVNVILVIDTHLLQTNIQSHYLQHLDIHVSVIYYW